MSTKTATLSELLHWVFLGVEYLSWICEENNISIDIEEIETYGDTHINILLYDVLKQEAEMFIGKYKYEIWEILEISDMNKYLAENEIYEIHTNKEESYVSFYDENIQALFEIKHWK